MARPTPAVPPLKLHKASGRGYVYADGRVYYLGRYDDPETAETYRRWLAEYDANHRRVLDKADLRISELRDAFLAFAQSYYRRPGGGTTGEVGNFKRVTAELNALYGPTLAREFTPIKLLAVRDRFVSKSWSRGGVNQAVNRIRHVFKWAVSRELVPSTILEGLRSIEPLRRGRTEAPETPAVKPVPQEHVNSIREHVAKQVWALVQLQLLTGARAGELVGIRAVDIDTTGVVWIYRPSWHKTAHRGHARTIYLGPKAQDVVRPFLAGRAIDAPLFSPAEAEASRYADLHAQRETPLSCGNGPGRNRKRNPQRKPGPQYTTATYRRAISRGCDAAEVPRWHPHQLRHNAATALEREFGLDTAAIILGHSSPAMTRVYAERDHARALEVMNKIG